MGTITKEQLIHRLHMTMILASETEKWALTLKGNVEHRFKFKLNNALGALEALRRECDQYVDRDDVDDVSEIFSQIIDQIKSDKRDEFLAYIIAYVNGEVEIKNI